MKLDLLLASAGGRPVLAESLDVDSTEGMDRPAAVSPSGEMRYHAADADALDAQRWGVVAPEGAAGTRLLAALAPLLAARREAQGGRPVFTRQVPPEMDAGAAARWKREELDRLPGPDQPRYLLFLGDLDQVSLDLQQSFGPDTFTGRLAFSREDHYEAYAAKVLADERRAAAGPPRVMFFSADGDRVTAEGREQLVAPIAAACRVQRDLGEGRLAAATVDAVLRGGRDAADELLRRAGAPDPTVLFTLSHGLADRGWTAQERRAQQGALSLGADERLTAGDVAGRPFLPGGVWFLFACFGAATPARSVFHHWLALLEAQGTLSFPARRVLDHLPRPGERPFVAALPQAALANPEGPLAVIGHADLAWSCAFLDPVPGGASHAGRFQAIVRALVDGHRAGVAENELGRFFAETSIVLTGMYDEEARGQAEDLGPDRDERKARLWMRRNNLGGYLLLGDPAAALSGARAGLATRSGAVEVRGLGVEEMEEAVLAVLRGADVCQVAGRVGAAAVEVTRWVEGYREVGRAVLGIMRRERGGT